MAEHKHGHNCGCGHDHEEPKHEHKHEHGGGCCGSHGHNHGHHAHGNHEHGHHAHGAGCCGKHHGHNAELPKLSKEQEEVLLELGKVSFAPLVRFIMKSSKSSHFESVALAPVYIMLGKDKMDEIKAVGKILSELEELEVLTLDYDIPLVNYEYSEYEKSPTYTEFLDMMKESAEKEEFVFDIAELEKGSIELTDIGKAIFVKLTH